MSIKVSGASALYEALQMLADELHRDAPMTQYMALLRIALAGDEGIDQAKVMDSLNISSAGMSRTVQALGPVHYMKDRDGFNLVDRAMDVTDNRKRVLKLTPKGEKLMAKVVEQFMKR